MIIYTYGVRALELDECRVRLRMFLADHDYLVFLSEVAGQSLEGL
ncbi:hypothetical protein [Nonomuraea sp. NPDC049158]